MSHLSTSRVGHRILRHVQALEFPRFPGSAGAQRAQAYVRSALHAMGYHVAEQEFESSLFPLEVLPRLGVALVTALLVTAYAFTADIPVFAFELGALSIVLLVAFTHWWKAGEGMYRFRKFGSVRSSNIIARHPRRGATVNVVFLAHYDSKHQMLSGSLRAGAFALMAALATLTVVMLLVVALTGWTRDLVLIPLLPLSLLALVLQVNGTTNNSPGAFDNASGVGVLLELAGAYIDQAPNCNVTFIATGAEEAGLCGAVALATSAWFMREYTTDRTVIINLDGIGSRGPLRITNRHGIPPVTSGRAVTELCMRICERFGIEARPVWIPTGAAMDHIPFAARGYQAITLSSAGWNRAFRSIHTTWDVADNLDASTLENCYAVCLEVLDSIPRSVLHPQVRED